MKAVINGIIVEGTPEELNKLMKLQESVRLKEMHVCTEGPSILGSTISTTKHLTGKLIGNY